MNHSYLFDETAHEIGLRHGCSCSGAHEMGGGGWVISVVQMSIASDDPSSSH